jgi:hypothetical protein
LFLIPQDLRKQGKGRTPLPTLSTAIGQCLSVGIEVEKRSDHLLFAVQTGVASKTRKWRKAHKETPLPTLFLPGYRCYTSRFAPNIWE